MMKALSIRQPWAWAIIHAGKDIENRDWPTNLRGRIAIHASATWPKPDYEIDVDVIRRITGKPVPPRDEFMLGAIIGTVNLTNCVGSSRSPWFFGDYGFALADPIPLATPIPFKGVLGFWEVPKDLIFNICERCGRSRNGHALLGGMHEAGACDQFVGEFDE